MENYCTVQTPLTYQYDSPDDSLMFIQNNFEWSQTSSENHFSSIFFHSTNFDTTTPCNAINKGNTEINNFLMDSNSFDLNNFNLTITTANINIDNSNNNSNQITGVSPGSQYGYFDEYLTFSANDHFNNNDKEGEIYDLNLDDSLKNVLHEIESIPSEFLEDFTLSSNPSSVSSLQDQEILSPSSFDLAQETIDMSADLWSNFNVPEIVYGAGTLECDSSSSESDLSSDDSFKLKKVNKSGRVNKRESNKVAAVRYRAKKSKERDQLFQECELFAKRNLDLKEKISDIEQQIGFIKNLLMQALANKK